MPFISFIIPAKNEELYIGKCLDSIKRQDYPGDIEIIVIDNGSSDKTKTIANQFDVKIITKLDGNISCLRNLGAKYSKGDLLVFVDADCILPSNWLSTALRHLQQSYISAVVSPEWWHGTEPTWVEKYWCMMKHPARTDPIFVDWCSSQALIIRRSVFEKLDGFNEKLTTCEDADLGYRLTSDKKSKILLDFSIKHSHLRASKNLKELFIREKWRGSGNLDGLSSHGVCLKEFASFCAPLFFGFSLIISFIFLITYIFSTNRISQLYTSIFFCLLALSIPIMFALYKLKSDQKINFPPYLVISVTYLAARFLAFFTRQNRTW